jgi:hypothetical protein
MGIPQVVRRAAREKGDRDQALGGDRDLDNDSKTPARHILGIDADTYITPTRELYASILLSYPLLPSATLTNGPVTPISHDIPGPHGEVLSTYALKPTPAQTRTFLRRAQRPSFCGGTKAGVRAKSEREKKRARSRKKRRETGFPHGQPIARFTMPRRL